jgi:hypothetical protein
MHISARAFDKAREVLKEIEKFPIASGNHRSRDEIHYLEARLALEEGDLIRAATAFDLIYAISPTYSVSRKGYFLALEVQIRLRQGAATSVIAPLVAELQAAHLQMRNIGSQDFESYSLYLGLCAVGEEDVGVQLLGEYVQEHRHVKWPLPQTILRALSSKDDRRLYDPTKGILRPVPQETAALRTDPLSGVRWDHSSAEAATGVNSLEYSGLRNNPSHI